MAFFLTKFYVDRSWHISPYHHMLCHLPLLVQHDFPIKACATAKLERAHSRQNSYPTSNTHIAYDKLNGESRWQATWMPASKIAKRDKKKRTSAKQKARMAALAQGPRPEALPPTRQSRASEAVFGGSTGERVRATEDIEISKRKIGKV